MDWYHVTALIALSCWHQWQMPVCFVCCVTVLRGTRAPGQRTKSETGMTLQLLQPLRAALPRPGQHWVTERHPRTKTERLDALWNQWDSPQISCMNQTNILINLCGTNPFEQRCPKLGPVGKIWLFYIKHSTLHRDSRSKGIFNCGKLNSLIMFKQTGVTQHHQIY